MRRIPGKEGKEFPGIRYFPIPAKSVNQQDQFLALERGHFHNGTRINRKSSLRSGL